MELPLGAVLVREGVPNDDDLNLIDYSGVPTIIKGPGFDLESPRQVVISAPGWKLEPHFDIYRYLMHWVPVRDSATQGDAPPESCAT